MRWIFSLVSIALGLAALRLSYVAYAKWQEYVSLGHPSGAEAYEVEFWPEAVIGVALIALGGFVAGCAHRGRGPAHDWQPTPFFVGSVSREVSTLTKTSCLVIR